MTHTKEVRKTGLLYCHCGGEPEYVGGMFVDQYRCNTCHWSTLKYYDGEPYAKMEWNKHQSQQKKDT